MTEGTDKKIDPSCSSYIVMEANSKMLYSLTYAEASQAKLMLAESDLLQSLNMQEVQGLASVYHGEGTLKVSVITSLKYESAYGALAIKTTTYINDPGWGDGSETDLDETQAAAQVYSTWIENPINAVSSMLQSVQSEEQQTAQNSQAFSGFSAALANVLSYAASLLAGSL